MPAAVAARDENRIARNKRQKLDRIMRTARRLFESKGFEATTMREIAAKADIGHGTLFLYARRKEDLLVMMFRDEVGRAVDEAIATVPRRPILEQILHVLGALTAHHERNVALARVFVKELPFVEDTRQGVAAFMTNLFARLAGLIARAQAAGELSADAPPMLLTRNLFAIYFNNLQRWLGHEPCDAAERDRWIHDALELQLGCFRKTVTQRRGSR
jgi:TetR/AcrR family transcriptional regulator, cholesterol catabolism regulator